MEEVKMRLVQLADEIIIAAEFLEVADSGAACVSRANVSPTRRSPASGSLGSSIGSQAKR